MVEGLRPKGGDYDLSLPHFDSPFLPEEVFLMELAARILSDVVVFMKYARYLPREKRRETWEEIVTRNKGMHLDRFPHLREQIEEAYRYVYDKQVLPSMRSMQFAGTPVILNPARLYNCCYLPMEHHDAFSEVMFLLLSGVGVGYSVQTHHVEQLPAIIKPTDTYRFLVSDSIEGWADAVKVLVKAYFTGGPVPDFDFRDIRPKGALLITSGGKAPGPEPLKDCLHNVKKILDRKQTGEQLTTLEVHDINCYIADAVLAGGIRRSAMISLFSYDDEDMLTAKVDKWYEEHPHRARANNTVVLLRHRITQADFMRLWEKIRFSGSGEPGFMMSNDQNWGTNPCAEISLRPYQFCNLTTINASDVYEQEELDARARAAATIATLQASYTHFHYLRPIWKRTTEKEALIGVSMTGIASGGVVRLDLQQAAQVVKDTNAEVAKLIGIRPAARTTTVKPEGTSSIVLGSSSGIHAWHGAYYIRRLRVGKNEPVYHYLAAQHPELLEDEYFKPNAQSVISVPQKAPDGAVTREEAALDLLHRVHYVYMNWVRAGHRRGHNTNNVSTTITIKPDEWDAVGEWMWQNRDRYTALSVLPHSEHTYPQLPFEDITEVEYAQLSRRLHEIDLSVIREDVDGTTLQSELACSGGACEVKIA